MSDGAPSYRTRTGDVTRDGERALAVWRGNLGDPQRMAAKLGWFYRGCPFGEPLLQLLEISDGAEVVGVAAAGPRRFRWRGRELTAGVLVDLAVQPAHRSLGPALMLQQSLIDAADARFDLLYGFPNPKAVPVFRRIGYRPLGEIMRYARVLRHRGYLARRLPSWLAAIAAPFVDAALAVRDGWRSRGAARPAAHWSDAADDGFDALWQRTRDALDDCAAATRDTAALRWRFDAEPGVETRYLVLRHGTDVVAWFACQTDDGVLHVRDFWSRDIARGVPPAQVLALLRAARRDGCAAVSMAYGGPPHRLAGWLACGFVERGRRPVFGRWNPRLAGDVPPALHLTPADEDE